MSDEEFEQLVAEGVNSLPLWVRKKMHNVAIVIAQEPSKEQWKTAELEHGHVLFGLYEGIPQTERDVDYFALPDKITVFKGAVLDSFSNLDEIRECVANTVWHEVAHHFGMDEDRVRSEELKRGKTK